MTEKTMAFHSADKSKISKAALAAAEAMGLIGIGELVHRSL
jgi:hypothetical protein